jgi:MFS superfamily sulfate permease-like transporter
MRVQSNEKPPDGLKGLKAYWKRDLASGFVISLIAMPLCLGIALASGVPLMAGIISGIIGGILLSFFSGSHLSINGPAAGLAVIVLSSVEGFRQMAPPGMPPADIDLFAYRCTLGVGVACGVLQLLFAYLRAGILSIFFPSSVVNGVLASIGIMIFVRQLHIALGVQPQAADMISAIQQIPASISSCNPKIVLIAALCLLIMALLPAFKNPLAKRLPVPLLVILAAIAMSDYFGLEQITAYRALNGRIYPVASDYLVRLPANLSESFVFPRFDHLLSGFGLEMVITIAMVASLESLLTTAAVDRLDPFKRKSDFNRELLSKGAGNIISSSIGGLPLIAEVVRSSANISNGAVTRWSNFFHGFFLLLFVSLLSKFIHHIPLAALAAMLMVIGFRLAAPGVFIKTFRLGKEQLLIFLSTIIVTLFTDMLLGMLAGVVVSFLINLFCGVNFINLFRIKLRVEEDRINETWLFAAEKAAVFSNYYLLRKKLLEVPAGKTIIVDLSGTNLVDSLVMESLLEIRADYISAGGTCEIRGLEGHRLFSAHRAATRMKRSDA